MLHEPISQTTWEAGRFCSHIRYHCKCKCVSSTSVDPWGQIPKRLPGKTQHCGKPTTWCQRAGRVFLESGSSSANWHWSSCPSTAAQVNGVRFRQHVHERVNVLSEQAGTDVAGNQFGQARRQTTDSPPSIIHAQTAGCSSVFSKHTRSHQCGAQMHPPQISNTDIRLKELINDRLSDEFLCSESQTGQRLRLSQEEVQQRTRNNYRYMKVETDSRASSM